MVKGLLGGLTVLAEVEALVFCSTGKPQDKDPRCLIPARLQNKRESCCFIKTTRHSVCSHPCVCVFFFYFPPPPPPPPLMQLCSCCARKMICALFDEVAAKLVKTSVEVRCLKRLYCFILICERFLKCVNQPPALSRALLRPSRWWISSEDFALFSRKFLLRVCF